MRQLQRSLLVVSFFVCPLIFFTDLTRNPYITQICLLNIALLLAGAALLWRASVLGPSELPQTPLNLPLAAWIVACALSWCVAYVFHRAFFRPAIAAQGALAFLFLGANALLPFLLGACFSREAGEDEVSLAAWAVFVLGWGMLWLAFPQLRAPSAPAADLWGHVWDGYGVVVWACGLAAALWLCRRGRWIDLEHLALATGFLASAYAVLQYFNIDPIWPHVLNPYGGRSVSTFGNPNFLSSFNVLLLPMAAVFFSRSRGGRRWTYGILFLTLEAALLCSLTRSSWAGALAALAVLAFWPGVRRFVMEEPRPHGLLAGLGVAMALLWPSSLIASGYAPSVIGRLKEVIVAVHTHSRYSSFYQRVLIWTCGWQMGAENPLTGKGFGLFELFYPFYQGHLLFALDLFRHLRTHANNAHNEIVEVWSQTGLVGLGIFAWLWATFFFMARRRFACAARQAEQWAACVAGVAGMLVDNMLNVSLHFAVPALLFWWTVGSCAGAGLPQAARRKASGLWRWGLRAAAAALAVLTWFWVCVWFREAHYFAGFKLLREKRPQAAIEELERSRAWGPREVNALYELGNAYAQSGRYQDALTAYRQALRANAGYDEIYFNIGTIESTRLGQPRQALPFYRMAQWINPISPEIYVNLGDVYLSDPVRYRDAGIDLLRQAVRIFPENAVHWSNLGYLCSLAKRYDEAQAAYLRALALDPELKPARVNLETLLRQTGRPHPAQLDAIAGVGELEGRILRHDYSPATLALAQRLDRRFPDNPKVRFFLGSLYMARGRPGEAARLLEWVVARQPDQVWARVNLAEAYLALRRPQDAAAQEQAVLRLDPGNAQARKRLAQLSGIVK
ncbi:MAG: tetratricopeptide repeat protein [Elusimicrobia bacterium]|nr:tetratricopeptide repeat protein [Elusimicrobiota bacterium]